MRYEFNFGSLLLFKQLRLSACPMQASKHTTKLGGGGGGGRKKYLTSINCMLVDHQLLILSQELY